MGLLEDAIAERERRDLVARATAERDRRAGIVREGDELVSGDFPQPEPPPVTRPGPAREFQNEADEFIRALGRGSLNIGSGLLSGFADVAVDSLFDAEKIEALAITAREEAQKPKFQPGTGGGIGAFIANAVGDALPFMAATIGATLVGGPTAGFGVAYSVEGKNAYFDALDAGATQSQAEIEGMIVGSINAAIEGLQVGRVMKFAKAGKGSVKAVAGAAKKNAIKTLVKQGTNITKEGVKLAITEGLQEATQETVSILAPVMTGREIQEEGKLRRIGQAAAGGAVAGVFLGGAGRISQAAANRFGIEVDEEGTPIQPEGQRFESEVAATLAGLQARADAKAKIAENVPLESAEREQFPELARQEDQIAQIRATDIRTLPKAPTEPLAEAPVAERPAEGAVEGVEPAKLKPAVSKAQQRNIDALAKFPDADVVKGTTRVRMENPKGAVFQVPAGQIQSKLDQGFTLLRKPKTVAPKPKPKAVKPPKKPVVAPKVLKKPAPVTPETKQTQPKVVAGEPVTQNVVKEVEEALAVDITDPAFPTSTKHASTKEIRDRLGIGQVNSKTRRSDEQALAEAVERKIPEKANRIADEVNANPRALSDIEDAGMRVKVAELEIEHEQLMKLIGESKDAADTKTLSAEAARVENEFDSILKALELSGTEAGRALRARKVQIGRDFKLVSVLNRAKAAAGKKLTAAKELLFKKLTSDLAATNKKVEALQVQVAELQAARTVKRGARRFTTMNKQQRQTSRKGLSAKVVELLQQGCAN